MRAMENLCRGNTHPNLVSIFQSGQLIGTPYYFIDMELCDYDLEDYLSRGGLKEEKILCRSHKLLKVFVDILNGVDFIHGEGEVHRDLKPGNGMFFTI
jgi:serine/threonine protein kinase